ncbi:MAG: TIGR01212 family radical SAM protein, partial [Clostridiaceae bacterium]|nr:TIGR01212 family radical SAM protein [Clostridiaceae bacterium]
MQSYPTLNQYLRTEFNKKMIKLPIDGGFSCPNRENGNKGCIFCSEKASGEFTYSDISIKDQITSQIKRYKDINKTDDQTGYIAYFQNFSNTYDTPKVLKEKYDEALSNENIKGIAIATRPDCINDDILELLKYYNDITHLWIELGFQTSNENTARFINRGYDNITFSECVKKLNKNEIKSVVHVIFGLPNEKYEDYISTIKYIKKRNIWGIKIHSLYIQKNTLLFYN